jgi:hypothetical protein
LLIRAFDDARLKRGALVRRVAVTFEDSAEQYPLVIHGEDGLVWRVSGVIAYWEHPDLGRYRSVPGHRGEAVRWELTVVGPLPGAPGWVGEQGVVLRAFADAWYMSPK